MLLSANLLIALRLFSTEFTQHLNSNEGSFMAIGRFIAERWPHVNWYPFWMNGMPFENAYSPLLPYLEALFALAAHRSTALAFHAIAALFYCLAPVLLFLFAWRASRLIHVSFLASFFYAVVSPSVLFPAVLRDLGHWLHARRLQTVVQYGEAAHNMVLALLPLVLLCAWIAVRRRGFGWYVLTGIGFGVLVLTNAFASVDLVLSLACLAAIQPPGQRVRSAALFAGIGGATYLWISPLLTPSLIRTIRTNSVLLGNYGYTAREAVAALLVLAGAAGLWWATRRLANAFERFAYLFAYIFFAIPALAHFARIYLLPQAERYHLEMEMGVSLALFFGARHLVRGRLAMPVAATILILLMVQTVHLRRHARGLLGQIDITKTHQYETAQWIATNLPGLRTMVSAETGLWFNVFSDNPQMSSGHDPFSPNWVLEIAVYAIYSDENAGTRAAENSIAWLKAFGTHAITIPNPDGPAPTKPFIHPHKFDGVLPLLSRNQGDSIYGVPQRSPSLAHVIPEQAVIAKQPANGLDIAEVERFDAALDDARLPLASFRWAGPSQAHISAPLRPGEVLAVQVTYDPGWIATANGRPARIDRDGIGLMTIRPECDGPCEVDLSFDGGLERKICRALSLLVMLLVAAVGVIRVTRWRAGRSMKYGDITAGGAAV